MFQDFFSFVISNKSFKSIAACCNLNPTALVQVISALLLFLIGNWLLNRCNSKNNQSREERITVSKELLWALSLMLIARCCRIAYPSVIELDRVSLLVLFLVIFNFFFKFLLFNEPLFFLRMDGVLLKPKSLFWLCLNFVLRAEGFFLKGSFFKAFLISFFGVLFLKLQLLFFLKGFLLGSFDDLAWFLILVSLFIKLYIKFRSKFILPVVKKDGVLEGSSLVSYLLGLEGASHLTLNSFNEGSHVVYSNSYKGLFLCKASRRALGVLFKKGFYKSLVFGLRLFGRVGLASFSIGLFSGYFLIIFLLFRDFCLVDFYASLIKESLLCLNLLVSDYELIIYDKNASKQTVEEAQEGMESCNKKFGAFILQLTNLQNNFFLRWCIEVESFFGLKSLYKEFQICRSEEFFRARSVEKAFIEDIKKLEESRLKNFFKNFYRP